MEYAIVCGGGSAGELCLSCAAPIVIETSVMNKTCDPVSIRVEGFDPEFRVPGFCGLTTVLGASGAWCGKPCRDPGPGSIHTRLAIYTKSRAEGPAFGVYRESWEFPWKRSQRHVRVSCGGRSRLWTGINALRHHTSGPRAV